MDKYQDAMEDLQGQADEILGIIEDMKLTLKNVDRGIYEAAKRRWISTIELAFGLNTDNWLAKDDSFKETMFELNEKSEEEADEEAEVK